ncbi:prepilin-type N-terminal cleavage/methylation domain-containing protein [bacterium]|nr:prepilin-type N-terminal cleavage/methylation domain-containing protein [bacterium]
MKNRGFTLTELLVVIVIIGILITLVVPNAVRAREKAKEAAVKTGIGLIETALEGFAQGNSGFYPGVAYDSQGVYTIPNNDNGLQRSGSTDYATGLGPQASNGVIGGRMDCMKDPQKCGGTTPANDAACQAQYVPPTATCYFNDVHRWDRLVLEGTISEYPKNPFMGTKERPRAMFNVFSTTLRRAAAGTDFVGTCLSTMNPDPANGWNTYLYYNSQSADGTADGRLGYPLSVQGGTPCDVVDANDANHWMSNPDDYPVGDFAYIPLDPVEPPRDFDGDGVLDESAYMAFVQGYWLIGYGAASSWRAEIYDVDLIQANGGLRFQAPLGRIQAANTATWQSNCTEVERRAMRALFGAIVLKGTDYTEQATPGDIQVQSNNCP